MKIIAHRGLWSSKDEQNTIESFKKCVEFGFGIETDVRDQVSRLVVSHDPPNGDALPLEALFEVWCNSEPSSRLAINIKSDGLQSAIKSLLAEYGIENYFVFDMSVPDSLAYCKKGLNVFTRQSEYEREPPFLEMASGVWIDEFESHWITCDVIQSHLRKDKDVCIVSPELHGRTYMREWEHYRSISKYGFDSSIMLCTDHPVFAKEFFSDTDN
jgi:hypothetical protein